MYKKELIATYFSYLKRAAKKAEQAFPIKFQLIEIVGDSPKASFTGKSYNQMFGFDKNHPNVRVTYVNQMKGYSDGTPRTISWAILINEPLTPEDVLAQLGERVFGAGWDESIARAMGGHISRNYIIRILFKNEDGDIEESEVIGSSTGTTEPAIINELKEKAKYNNEVKRHGWELLKVLSIRPVGTSVKKSIYLTTK